MDQGGSTPRDLISQPRGALQQPGQTPYCLHSPPKYKPPRPILSSSSSPSGVSLKLKTTLTTTCWHFSGQRVVALRQALGCLARPSFVHCHASGRLPVSVLRSSNCCCGTNYPLQAYEQSHSADTREVRCASAVVLSKVSRIQDSLARLRRYVANLLLQAC